jgi:hypothetical protein
MYLVTDLKRGVEDSAILSSPGKVIVTYGYEVREWE